MRRLSIALLVTLMLAACHSKQNRPIDSVPCDQIGRDTVVADSVSDSIEPASPSSEKTPTVHRDTAATTNLRLFARKQTIIYSPALMVGEWHRGSEHEQYMSDGTGRHWDTGEDVQRDEAKPFTWTLDSNLLTFKYNITLGGLMVRQYVVTFVDDETLVYSDAYGDSYMWDKLPATVTDN